MKSASGAVPFSVWVQPLDEVLHVMYVLVVGDSKPPFTMGIEGGGVGGGGVGGGEGGEGGEGGGGEGDRWHVLMSLIVMPALALTPPHKPRPAAATHERSMAVAVMSYVRQLLVAGSCRKASQLESASQRARHAANV
jgi:hypothetical protein